MIERVIMKKYISVKLKEYIKEKNLKNIELSIVN